jgi:hypothetical protein
MIAVPPGRAERARCGVLGRTNGFDYWRSLRPCIAPVHRAQIDEHQVEPTS